MIESDFFNRNAEIVARELLGKVLIRRVGNGELRARIVETEAYFDEKDPASRACQNGDLRDTMMMEAGRILVYGIHNNWMLNFVTGFEGNAQAVLIRAVEPLNFEGRGNGPGLLTKSLEIDKSHHKRNIIDNNEVWLENDNENIEASEVFEIIESFRIGVREDLDKPLRFYIKGNKWVSRR